MKNLKKFFGMLLIILLVLSPIVYVDAKTTKKTTTTTTTTTAAAKKPINIYVFYGESCPHCQELHAYIDTLKEDKSINYMFNVVDYEVWSNETNYNLMVQVGQYFEIDVDGVPFYVIGDSYFSGFGESGKESLITTIKNEYNSNDYVDVVGGIGTGEITGTVSENDDTKKANNTVGMVILGITVVIVIVLIVSSSKNKYYEDDEEEEEEIEEVSPKKSESVEKKSTAKKTVKKETTKTTTKKTNNKSTATKSKAKTTKNTKTSKKK